MSCQSCSTPGITVPTAPAFPAFPPPVGQTVVPAASSSGSSTTDPAACPDYLNLPKLKQKFTAVALNGNGQFFSQCAYLWAVPGATIFLPPFGIVNILGVTGDVITYKNVSIASGTAIEAGTLLLQGAPPAETTSQQQAQLDSLSGFLNGSNAFIKGTANQLLRWNTVGANVLLEAINGMIFVPNTQYSAEIAPKDVAGAALPGTGTTPIPDATVAVTAYYDMPNLPAASLLPATFFALVHIRQSSAAIVATSFTISHQAVEIADLIDGKTLHTHVLLPVSGTKFSLDYAKTNVATDRYARVRVKGYFF